MHVSRTLAATFSAVFAVLAVTPRAQEAHPTFRAATQRVALSVVVRDGRGRPVNGLSLKDFRVLDNGFLAHISDFASEDQPMRVALLIDTSGSMVVGQRLANARQAVKELVRQLRPGLDSAGLFTFDRRLHEVSPFSGDVASLDAGLNEITPFGSTSLRDAIAAAARRLAGDSTPRRAVIVISDGLDTSSEMTSGDVARLASGIDVPVYVLDVHGTIDPLKDPFAETTAADPIELVALRTSGAALAANTTVQVMGSVREILTDLRSSYLVAFAPRNVPGWHQLSVTVARDYATVRTRTAFWLGDSSF